LGEFKWYNGIEPS